jgi:hypothetical protein
MKSGIRQSNCVAVRSATTQDEEDRNTFNRKYKALLEAKFRDVKPFSKGGKKKSKPV